MTWAGESGPSSGLYVFTDDGSPGVLVGNQDQVVMWKDGLPDFASQASITGSRPLQLRQIQDVDVGDLVLTNNVLKWTGTEWKAREDDPYSSGVFASGDITTTSASYTHVPGISGVLPSGFWYVVFRGVAFPQNQNSSVFIAVRKGGGVIIEQAVVEIRRTTGLSLRIPFTTNATIHVDGSETIEGVWRVTGGGTGAMFGIRELELLKVREKLDG